MVEEVRFTFKPEWFGDSLESSGKEDTQGGKLNKGADDPSIRLC
jgi:hypothetical protein